MADDFCPETIQVDGDTCARYERFTERYLWGLVRFEVCNYRCPGRVVHSRVRLKLGPFAVGGVLAESFDPADPPPIPPDAPCEDAIQQGVVECRLLFFWRLSYLGGLITVDLCAYLCGEQFYTVRSRARFLGIPAPRRERQTFPYPF